MWYCESIFRIYIYFAVVGEQLSAGFGGVSSLYHAQARGKDGPHARGECAACIRAAIFVGCCNSVEDFSGDDVLSW